MNHGIITTSAAKLKRLRKRAIVKSIVIGVILAGGVTTGILLPNPISMAVILACSTLLSGGEGIKHTIKRFKSTKVIKNEAKAVVKAEAEAVAAAVAEANAVAKTVERLRQELLYPENSPERMYPTLPASAALASAPPAEQAAFGRA